MADWKKIKESMGVKKPFDTEKAVSDINSMFSLPAKPQGEQEPLDMHELKRSIIQERLKGLPPAEKPSEGFLFPEDDIKYEDEDQIAAKLKALQEKMRS